MEIEFQIDQKDMVEQMFAAVGIERDQTLMQESLFYIDGCILLKQGNNYVRTIMFSKELRKYCYYE